MRWKPCLEDCSTPDKRTRQPDRSEGLLCGEVTSETRDDLDDQENKLADGG